MKKLYILILLQSVNFYAGEITQHLCIRNRPPVKEMVNNVDHLVSMCNPSSMKKNLGLSHGIVSPSDVQTLNKIPNYIRKDLKTNVFDHDHKTMISCDEEDVGVCFATSGGLCLGAGIMCCDDRLDLFLRLLGICPICWAIGLCACWISMDSSKNYKEKQY